MKSVTRRIPKSLEKLIEEEREEYRDEWGVEISKLLMGEIIVNKYRKAKTKDKF